MHFDKIGFFRTGRVKVTCTAEWMISVYKQCVDLHCVVKNIGSRMPSTSSGNGAYQAGDSNYKFEQKTCLICLILEYSNFYFIC